MNRTTTFVIILIIFLSGCESKKENFEFTFFRWSIHEDYYLKINSSDTIYFVKDNPIERQTKFAILQPQQKEEIESKISRISFPDKESYSNSVEDGLTYAFLHRTNNKLQKVSVHAHAGPKEFWSLGEYLETLKQKSHFISTSKMVDLEEMKHFVLLPFPPNYNSNGH